MSDPLGPRVTDGCKVVTPRVVGTASPVLQLRVQMLLTVEPSQLRRVKPSFLSSLGRKPCGLVVLKIYFLLLLTHIPIHKSIY